MAGKHLSFNGRAQHGVVGSLCTANCTEARLVLLINWWEHTPEPPNCQRLASSQLQGMGMQRVTNERLRAIKALLKPVAAEPLELTADADGGPSDSDDSRTVTITLPPADKLHLQLPSERVMSALTEQGTTSMHFRLPWEAVSLLGEIDVSK